MFDLENAITRWLRSFRKHRAFNHGSIREMELHLRDHIDDLLDNGHTEEEAFKLAVAEFGEIPNVAKEEFWNVKKKTDLRSIAHAAIFRNFYFTALRHFYRHKNYFFINVLGLATGITGFILIALYIVNELSYDRFHANFENIYRINTESTTTGLSTNFATTNSPLAKTLLSDYAEVVQATRVLRNGTLLVGLGNEYYSEEGVLFADSSFLDVFDFRLLKGNPQTALVHPRSMILTESHARKYFGDEDPLGRQITVENDTNFYLVTGVVEDVPANSHIQFDILGSMSTRPEWNDDRWIGENVHTYIVLGDHTKAEVLVEKMQEIVYKHVAPEIEYYTGQTMAEWEKAGNQTRYSVIPLKDIHLHSTSTRELEANGNISYILVYAFIGVIILFIAIFNFVNMATAQSSLRAKEVGVRKVVGSSKSSLVYQFILESIMLSLFATILSLLVIKLMTPSFVALTGKELAIGLTSGYWIVLSIIGLAILVGILGGCYPAFILAAFQPVDVLKGVLNKGSKSGWLRNLLVMMQFTASIVIIVGTLVVYRQIDFMLTRDLGFDKDQVLVIRRPDVLKENLQAFKNDLLLNGDITAVANSASIPGKGHARRSYRPKDDAETFLFMFNHVSYDYPHTMGLQLASGRFFSRDHRTDSNAVLINQAAARALGFEDPVGRYLTSPWHPGELLKIIGVVKDYNIESLHKKIEPVALELMPSNMNGYITVKISDGQNIRQTVQYIQDSWSRHSNGKPFESFFFDDDYENLYKSELTTGQVFFVFAALSIFIACLGLIGLLAFTASIRRKEIGIRKILGAGSGKLIGLLSTEFVRLIIVATLVGWPLAYFGSEYWLRNFADRLHFDPWLYVAATAIVVLICGIAISFQVLKAIRTDPVTSLRQE